MSRIAYVNGSYQRHAEAGVAIEDRGLQFADAVYEVWSLRHGVLLDSEGHFTRLERSLNELRIAMPMGIAALKAVIAETVRRNRLRDGLVYLQITRGVAPRNHVFPTTPVAPGVIITAKPVDWAAIDAKAATGARVVTVPDQRWARCDIKSTSLLPNVLAKQAAADARSEEAWMVDAEGYVTEGSSTNAWIVDREGALVTRDATANILNGITRRTIMSVAADRQMRVVERAFTVAEAQAAHEAFFTAATALVTPVVAIDGKPVGDGAPGPVAKALRAAYLAAFA